MLTPATNDTGLTSAIKNLKVRSPGVIYSKKAIYLAVEIEAEALCAEEFRALRSNIPGVRNTAWSTSCNACFSHETALGDDIRKEKITNHPWAFPDFRLQSWNAKPPAYAI